MSNIVVATLGSVRLPLEPPPQQDAAWSEEEAIKVAAITSVVLVMRLERALTILFTIDALIKVW